MGEGQFIVKSLKNEKVASISERFDECPLKKNIPITLFL